MGKQLHQSRALQVLFENERICSCLNIKKKDYLNCEGFVAVKFEKYIKKVEARAPDQCFCIFSFLGISRSLKHDDSQHLCLEMLR